MNTTIMRHFSTIAGVAGVITLAAAVPALAADSPVNVVSCDFSSSQRDGGQLIPATAPFQTGNVRISLVNQAPLPATNVRFAVSYGDRTQIINDAGTFSSGTPITQDFVPSVSLPYNGSASCSVQSVTFSDGSSWQPA